MRKFIASLLATLIFMLGLGIQPSTAAITPPCVMDGSGTSSDPWKVTSQADMAHVGLSGPSECAQTSTRDQWYSLQNDIELTGVYTPTPLYAANGYLVSFNGNGHKISGMRVVAGVNVSDPSYPGGRYAGLFSATTNAEITSLELEIDSVTGDRDVGGLVGSAINTEIYDVKISLNNFVTGPRPVSGSRGDSIGGIAGYLENSSINYSTIRTRAGWVGGISNVGGIAGKVRDSELWAVAAFTEVVGDYYVGGLVGSVESDQLNSKIEQSLYSGQVTANQNMAGLVGQFYSTNSKSLEISDSGVLGTVSTNTSQYSPVAFVGYSANATATTSVVRSYSAARYEANSLATTNIAGIAGVSQKETVDNLGLVVAGSTLDSAQFGLISIGLTNGPWQITTGRLQRVSPNSDLWVVDSGPNPLNDGYPMPTRVFNTGFFGMILGSTGSCPAGKYSPYGGYPCVDADSGFYVSQIGATQQRPCLSGYESAVGATVCTLIGGGGGGGGGGGAAVVAQLTHKNAPKISGTVAKAKSIKAVAGTWSSEKPVTETYKWFACDRPAASTTAAVTRADCTAIAGAAAATYPVGSKDLKKFLVLEVKATDGSATAVFSTASVSAKGLKYLSFKALPKVSGLFKVGKTVSVGKFSWGGTARPVKVSYQWFSCGVAVVASESADLSTCKAVKGATKASYRLAKSGKGKYLAVKVSGTAGSVKLAYSLGSQTTVQ